jgi:hypothetical protein
MIVVQELERARNVAWSPYANQEGDEMRTSFKGAAIAMGLVVATLGSVITANAAVGVAFDIGNVAVGYSDGYMGTDNQFHRWAHASDARRFRTAHKDQYHGYKHDDSHHH